MITYRDYASFSLLTYQNPDNYNSYNYLPLGWEMLSVCPNNLISDHYFGIAFINHDARQIVIAHRGTAKIFSWDFFEDILVAMGIAPKTLQSSAIPFGLYIRNLIGTQYPNVTFNYFQTGHSLGAVLAELSSVYFDVPCVSFDSPGSFDITLDLIGTGFFASDAIEIANQNVQTFNAAPHYINTINHHVGQLIRIYPPYDFSWVNSILNPTSAPVVLDYYVLQQHKIAGILEQFDYITGAPMVFSFPTAWPYGIYEAQTFYIDYDENPFYWDNYIATVSGVIITDPQFAAIRQEYINSLKLITDPNSIKQTGTTIFTGSDWQVDIFGMPNKINIININYLGKTVYSYGDNIFNLTMPANVNVINSQNSILGQLIINNIPLSNQGIVIDEGELVLGDFRFNVWCQPGLMQISNNDYPIYFSVTNFLPPQFNLICAELYIINSPEYGYQAANLDNNANMVYFVANPSQTKATIYTYNPLIQKLLSTTEINFQLPAYIDGTSIYDVTILPNNDGTTIWTDIYCAIAPPNDLKHPDILFLSAEEVLNCISDENGPQFCVSYSYSKDINTDYVVTSQCILQEENTSCGAGVINNVFGFQLNNGYQLYVNQMQGMTSYVTIVDRNQQQIGDKFYLSFNINVIAGLIGGVVLTNGDIVLLAGCGFDDCANNHYGYFILQTASLVAPVDLYRSKASTTLNTSIIFPAQNNAAENSAKILDISQKPADSITIIDAKTENINHIIGGFGSHQITCANATKIDLRSSIGTNIINIAENNQILLGKSIDYLEIPANSEHSQIAYFDTAQDKLYFPASNVDNYICHESSEGAIVSADNRAVFLYDIQCDELSEQQILINQAATENNNISQHYLTTINFANQLAINATKSAALAAMPALVNDVCTHLGISETNANYISSAASLGLNLSTGSYLSLGTYYLVQSICKYGFGFSTQTTNQISIAASTTVTIANNLTPIGLAQTGLNFGVSYLASRFGLWAERKIAEKIGICSNDAASALRPCVST